MKLKDITNQNCDVRKYMGIGMSDDGKYMMSELYDIDEDVIEDIIEDIIGACEIYVKHEHVDEVIEPFDLDKFLEERSE